MVINLIVIWIRNVSAKLRCRCSFSVSTSASRSWLRCDRSCPLAALGIIPSKQTNIPQKALESFYALGPSSSVRIMAKHSIHKLAKVGSLAPKTVTSLTAELSQMTLDSDAKKLMQDNIRRLRDIGSYRGRRHAMGMPVRGQRTRTQTATANKLNRVDRRS